MRYVHGPDMSGSKCGEKMCDGACHRGVTNWSALLRADGQEGDQFKAVQGLTVMEELCWLVANLMEEGEAEESSEANLLRAWGIEQDDDVINRGRRGPALPVSSDLCVLVLYGGSNEGEKSGETWYLVYWRQGWEPMASPSTRSGGQRRWGCHYSGCLGANLQKGRGKWPEEDQSRDVGSGSLAEKSYAVENSVGERRVNANLEKAM